MKNLIITGTSSGLGKALFDLVSNLEEVRLLCIARRFLPYQRTLSGTSRGRVQLARFDLGTEFSVGPLRRCLERFVRQKPADTVLINNAGVIGPIGPAGMLDDAAMRSAMFVNCVSPMRIANELLRAAVPVRSAVTILHISSGAARRPIAGWAVYCASKAAAAMFFDTVAGHDVAGRRVKALCIDPGVMDTAMQRTIRNAPVSRFPLKQLFVDFKKQHKLIDPREMAARIVKKYILS